ncbi:hypothetical protein SAMD00019534_034040 [Acytostelium subglobosum LB1]|uniref:hypothetical protein n=1 Tax=Acytostelium subglobosum LB1 TaxID=1410327 RepID=UPI000644AA8E|nr:hypothetical protein SAMD00019534_034040 [Acytostelium subglobosum LB1]GAM20229.1 hypothetical protein SAMD00019534_034040 [Acytostelium subglobosum LB1]|eukprot:XP_012759750.1 hypothetical protein SAMD00019534_034040 [Acytostelium subglobosum LB1]
METIQVFPVLTGLTELELQALDDFKKQPVTNNIPDQYLMVYLFSKKLNVEKACELLSNNLAFRKKLDLPFPVRKSDVNIEIVKKMYSFFVPNKRDQDGRIIAYLHPCHLLPKNYTLKEMVASMLWNSDITIYENQSMIIRAIAHRNGMVIVEDLKNVGMKNFDQRLPESLKEMKLAMENVFPGRAQAIYLINQPFFLRFLLSLAKKFIKSKLVRRVKVIGKKEAMKDVIDPSHLLEEYGGTLKFDFPAWVDSLPADY